MATEADPLAAAAAAADRGELGPAADPAPAPAAADPGAAPAIVDESAQWIEAAVQYGPMIRELVPDRAAPHWTPERMHRFGVELARCAKHYGWKFGSAANPIVGLVLAGLPLAWPIAEPYVRPYLRGAAPAAAAASSPAIAELAASGSAPAASGPAIVPVKPIG